MKLVRQDGTDTFLLENDRGEKIQISKGDNIAVQVVTNIVATALSLTIRGSINGNNFDDIESYSFDANDLSTKSATYILHGYALNYLAVDLTTLTDIISSQVNVYARIS